ncbi:MAG: aminotransferase class III-fold pyridoxal phosphate-dependent enzyme, partial [Pedosphaera sp.]|nr:aminotransferase class III-fold pyridoxal phosphate-dependent enzyme [Pedosphaera sp.]
MAMEHLKSEGDINLTSHRTEWMAQNLDEETRYWLEEDARYFLHQALSTPCLDVLKGAEGAAITTLRGRELLDFHGNNVHQVGFGHPRIIEAITRQMQDLAFCTRRYT